MTQNSPTLLFVGVVLGVVALPGLDMAFVMGSSLALGRKQGLAAVAGIVVGGACLVTLTALGMSVLVMALPLAFDALLLAGALYLAWIGVALVRSGTSLSIDVRCGTSSVWITFRRGVLTSLMNPKAYLFMLAILPQFLHADHRATWLQAVLLWFIIATTQTGVYGTVAISAARARDWLAVRRGAVSFASRMVGIILIIAALTAVLKDWRSG